MVITTGPESEQCTDLPYHFRQLADCGASRRVRDETMTHIGTPLYAAPEMLAGKRYDESIDVYSFGVVICEVKSKALPFAHVP